MAVVVVALVLVADLRGAIGFSSFTVLTYYAIANLSALTLGARSEGGHVAWRPQAVATLGVVGCVVLAFTLPWRSVAAGVAVLAAGALWHAIRRRLARRRLSHREPGVTG